MARWHTCNVVQMGAGIRRAWQFDAGGDKFGLNRQESVPVTEPLSEGMIGKSWSTLWQPKLNVAWLPPESVFLRVVHLPAGSFEEALSMVELQLEKLSPIPVTQALWSALPIPRSAGATPAKADGKEGSLLPVIVVIAERKAVEEFLGQLEAQKYMADRLELPVLDELLATTIHGDGAWIYPGIWGGKNTAIIAWWYGGVLQNLNLVLLPGAGDMAGLKEQLAQMAWAGELEGWLTGPPAWHLVADKDRAAEWEPALRQALDEPIAVSASPTDAELAAMTARRAAKAASKVNLLPADFGIRYHQMFVDRLWMRGLFSVAGLYAIGVAVYFVMLGYLNVQASRTQDQMRALGMPYTNAIQMKERYQVLKDRQNLKFAALDCWKAVADLTPTSITLEGLSFTDGKKLQINGITSDSKELFDFTAALRKAQNNNGQLLFDTSHGPGTPELRGQNWILTLDLDRGEGS